MDENRGLSGDQVIYVGGAIEDTDVVLFAIPSPALAETVAQLADLLNGKILIYATNKVGASPMHQLELLRKNAPNSALFRAFSNLGWENFVEPVIGA